MSPRQAALGLLILPLMLVLVARGAEAGVRSPLQGSGEIDFLADMPIFYEEDGAARVDLAVRVDHDDLLSQARNAGPDRWICDVVVSLKLAREGVVAVDTLQVFRVVGDRDSGPSDPLLHFELLEIAARVPEGRWAATVELHVLDEPARARSGAASGSVVEGPGSVGRLDAYLATIYERTVKASDVVARHARGSGVLEVPRWPEGLARVSDPEFQLRSTGSALPHPERLYGVTQDTLEAYVEVMGAPPGEVLRLGVEIHDLEYGSMDATVLELEPRATIDAAKIRLPLELLPDGNYVLRLIPQWYPEQVLESEFTVSWHIARATQARDDVMMEAELVLSADEFVEFQRLSRSVQIQRIQRFWDERDPTPGTARNEIYERFLARVIYATRHFGEAQRRGPLTDRGKIYIRYGPPSETEVTVMPSTGDELAEAIERVHGTFNVSLQGYFARPTNRTGQDTDGEFISVESRTAEESLLESEADLDKQRNFRRVGREGSFELWRYESMGDPLFDEMRVWSEDIDLRFLFVDRTGIGRYQLDYSNLRTHH